jgi:hypothetical protein
MTARLVKEVKDQIAHAASSFIVLAVTAWLDVLWTPEAAILVAWALGFVREFTEWEDGGKHPFTRWGILDQLGWILGGVVFVGVVL